MHYNSLRLIYPPRIETKIPPKSVGTFDNGTYLAQPKLNGSSVSVYSNGKITQTFNRRKEHFNTKILSEIAELYRFEDRKKWMVLCGEYMNKNKKDELNQYWNHKYVIWDILVYNGDHLVGSTFEERYRLLEKLFPANPVKKHLHQISENCFRVNAFETGFEEAYEDMTLWDMYEGLTLKKKSQPLEMGTTPGNTKSGQFKVRKPTKNYRF